MCIYNDLYSVFHNLQSNISKEQSKTFKLIYNISTFNWHIVLLKALSKIVCFWHDKSKNWYELSQTFKVGKNNVSQLKCSISLKKWWNYLKFWLYKLNHKERTCIISNLIWCVYQPLWPFFPQILVFDNLKVDKNKCFRKIVIVTVSAKVFNWKFKIIIWHY